MHENKARYCAPRAGQAPFCVPQYGQAPLCVPAGARTCATARASVRVFVPLRARKDFCMKSALFRAAGRTSAPVRPLRSRAPLRSRVRPCAPRDFWKSALLRAAGFDEHPLFTPGEREFAGKMPQNAPKCPPEMRRCLTKRVFAYYNYKNGSIWIYCSCPPNYVYARSKTGSWGVWAGFVRCLVFCLDLGFRH